MAAPRHIVDALESVLSIYFSNCRHKERAAFILTDELVEITCREKVKLRHRARPAADQTRPLVFENLNLDIFPSYRRCSLSRSNHLRARRGIRMRHPPIGTVLAPFQLNGSDCYDRSVAPIRLQCLRLGRKQQIRIEPELLPRRPGHSLRKQTPNLERLRVVLATGRIELTRTDHRTCASRHSETKCCLSCPMEL